jgi:hypothetical protein
VNSGKLILVGHVLLGRHKKYIYNLVHKPLINLAVEKINKTWEMKGTGWLTSILVVLNLWF